MSNLTQPRQAAHTSSIAAMSLHKAQIPLDLSCRRPVLQPASRLFLEQIICRRPGQLVCDLSETYFKPDANFLIEMSEMKCLSIFVTCSSFVIVVDDDDDVINYVMAA